MKTALLVSPHLDDAVFSCGGIAARLVRSGWRVLIATVFTRSVHPAHGFALACQRDKGLPDDLDYMALRRGEDAAAMSSLGAAFLHLDLPEAPHRGYASAAALFGERRPDDDVAAVTRVLAQALSSADPSLILAPQGCGRHVDHIIAIEALLACDISATLGFYRDTPYVIRDATATPHALVAAAAPRDVTCMLDRLDLSTKQDAACCYGSQLGFQFGGPAEARAALADLAHQEAGGGASAERLLSADPALSAMLA